MKKNVALVVGAIVVLGGGYFAYTKFSGKSAGNSVAQKSVKENTIATNKTEKGTFAALVARGEDLKCTFEYNDGANSSSGTIYITDSGKRVRGDFNVKKSAGGAMQATLVRVDGYNHIWSSVFSQGVKTKVVAGDETKLLSAKDGGVDENTEFDCTSWTVDASKFTLPEGVKFMDMSAMQQTQVK